MGYWIVVSMILTYVTGLGAICFFMQKTAYEMRISDWSSDVCSSDLMKLGRQGAVTAEQARTLAIQALAEVAKGNDPLENRNSARKSIAVKELCELYIK